jgi:siroheme synthase (precorrin-2 oxidase/ferrochelatase)
VLRQGPVNVAVSTSGYSPALAAWIRDRIAADLGPEVALLAELLSEARDELKAAGRLTEEVDWRRALDSDMLDLIRTGHTAQARERLQACLS